MLGTLMADDNDSRREEADADMNSPGASSPRADYGGLARAHSDDAEERASVGSADRSEQGEGGSAGARDGGRKARRGRGDSKAKGDRRSPPPAERQPSQTQQGPPAHRVYETGPRRTRIVFVGNLNGRIQLVNNIIKQTGATAVVHSGAFGFVDDSTYERMDETRLRARVSALTNIAPPERARLLALPTDELRKALRDRMLFSDLPLFLSGDGYSAKRKLLAPLYTVWGPNEDVEVIERLRNETYTVDNLFILDHTQSYKIADLRLLGLGGDIDYTRLMDQGHGEDVAGECGRTWATLSQIADLLRTAEAAYDSTEIRLLVTHASAGQEPLVAMLSHSLQCDFTASGHLRTNMCVAYNHWSVQDATVWSTALNRTKQAVDAAWATAGAILRDVCSEEEYSALLKAVDVTKQQPPLEDTRHVWNIGLCDAGLGWANMMLNNGKVGLSTFCEGRDFTPRRRYAEKARRINRLKQEIEKEREREREEAEKRRERESAKTPADESGITPSQTPDAGGSAADTPVPESDTDGAGPTGNRDRTVSPIGKEDGLTVFVKGLPPVYTKDDAAGAFGACKVRRVTALNKPGSFYIEMEDRESVDTACRRNKDTVEGKEILVEVARPARKPQQDRRPPPTAKPIRSGPTPCRYYMRDRSCRSGATCKFAHIDK